jgi:hypothetical protein
MPFVPVKGFAPDAASNEEGILVEPCGNITPTLNGVEALPNSVDPGIASAASAIVAATTLEKLDGTFRTFGGSDKKLYEAATASWTDRTRAVGGDYSLGANARWTFAQYGDRSFAAQKGDVIQDSSSGAFADLTTAPQCSFVAVALDFVFAFDTNDATYGDSPDRWMCCAAGNPESWTANVATQATTNRLTDEPGPITGAHALGDRVIAFKEQSMFVGDYVGPPNVWTFRAIPSQGLGAPSHYSTVNIESALLFIGQDNFYLYDGTRPVPIGTQRVAHHVLDEVLDWNNKKLVVGVHDRTHWRVYWWYPTTSSNGVLTKYVCYNYRSDRWGCGEKTVAFAWEYVSGGMTYDELGTYYSTYDDLPTNASYDTLFATLGKPQTAIMDTDKKLYTLTGTGSQLTLTTGDYGVDGVITVLQRVRPRFRTSPTSATQTHMYKDDLGATEKTSIATTTLTNGAFDHVFAARWHRMTQVYTGGVELLGWDITLAQDSME